MPALVNSFMYPVIVMVEFFSEIELNEVFSILVNFYSNLNITKLDVLNVLSRVT